MHKQIKCHGQYVNINGAKVWQNADGTFEEATIVPNPKVTAWFKKGLKVFNS